MPWQAPCLESRSSHQSFCGIRLRTESSRKRCQHCTRAGSTPIRIESFKWRLSITRHPCKTASTRFVFESWINYNEPTKPFIGHGMEKSQIGMERWCLFFKSAPPSMPGENVDYGFHTKPDAGPFGIHAAHETASNNLVKAWLARLIVDEAGEARLRCRSWYFVWKTGTSKNDGSFTALTHTTNAFVWERLGASWPIYGEMHRPTDYPLAVPFVCVYWTSITPWCMTVTSTDSECSIIAIDGNPIAHQELFAKSFLLPRMRLGSRCYCVQQGGRTVTFKA